MTSWPQEDLEMQVIEIIVIDDAGEAPENMELGEIEADKKQVQFTDLNDYCVVHIFDFLDVSSKVNFRKGWVKFMICSIALMSDVENDFFILN